MSPLPPNPLGIKIIAFSAAGLFADFVVVSLRLWARRLRKQRLGVGDWLIIASWFFALTDFIRRIIAYKWGAGLHLQQILETDPSHLLDAVKISYACYFIWNAAVTCIKLSILFVYLELFRVIKWFVWCVRAIMFLCVFWFFGFAALLLFRCSPMEKNFNYTVEGTCAISLPDGFILAGSLNMLLDVVLVVLPIPVVWRLRIGRADKIGICAMFGLGIFILIIVGFRFKMIEGINPDDLIHDIEPPGILVALELYLGMISACLPFLMPPISQLYKAVVGSNIVSKITSYTSRTRSDEGQVTSTATSEFSVGSWPTSNGYGRSYKVECDPECVKDETASKNITLTSEWEVKVVKNKGSFSSGKGLLEGRH